MYLTGTMVGGSSVRAGKFFDISSGFEFGLYGRPTDRDRWLMASVGETAIDGVASGRNQAVGHLAEFGWKDGDWHIKLGLMNDCGKFLEISCNFCKIRDLDGLAIRI